LGQLLDAVVDGIAVGCRGLYAGGHSQARDRVEEMISEGCHIEVATGRGAVQVVAPDHLDDIAKRAQCLFGTREFVRRLS
jgi:hypothetical protein